MRHDVLTTLDSAWRVIVCQLQACDNLVGQHMAQRLRDPRGGMMFSASIHLGLAT